MQHFSVRQHDLISSIEAAYDIESDRETWLQGLLKSVQPALDQGGGVLGYFYDYSDGKIRISGATGVDVHTELLDLLVPLIEGLGPAALRYMFLQTPRIMASVSEVLSTPRVRDYLSNNPTGPLSFGDTVGVKCHEPEGWGLMIGTSVAELTKVDRATERVWSRFAAHVASALRIRRKLQEASELARPDAVLDSNGKLSHAEIEAQDSQARELLSTAVRSREKARGPLRRDSPEEAAELWKALVDGRWSLLDQHDADGRRWILARRNAPVAVERPSLSPREYQVLAYIALGHSNKLVAYTLGMSVSAVGNLVARASRKLGTASRVELVEWLNQTGVGGDGEA